MYTPRHLRVQNIYIASLTVDFVPIMRSPASYTCRRCLNALRSCHSPSSSGFAASRRIPVEFCKRRISSQARNSSVVAVPGAYLAMLPRREPGRRWASTAGQQGQRAKDEPPEIRSPPGLASTPAPETSGRPLLLPNNLFHPLSTSPSPEIRRRAAFIKQNAYCPHADHRQTRLPNNPDDPEARKAVTGTSPPQHVSFECPDCGIPVSCSEEHWADDYESHLEICDTLREINEDDHDLRSGRFFPEFEYPGPQIEEAMVNMTNWDTFLYSREFRAINDERSLRQATRLLTYPVTIASVLHDLSPYSIRSGGRLTVEGLKSLSGKFDNLSEVFAQLTRLQLFAIHSTLQNRGLALVSKASDQPLHRYGYSFSALEPSRPYRGKSGSS
jgi:mitochondrial splicing suppressor protein 51